jgi:DNA-binding NarL/FixJ family response regulator
MSEIKKLSIALVEDDHEIRDVYSFLINKTENMSCVGFEDAETFMIEFKKAPHDIVIMDVNLPGISGIECTEQVKKHSAETQVMMFTVYENNENIFKALEAGASGYLVKHSSPASIIESINLLAEGGAPMSGPIARKVLDFFNKTNKKTEDNEFGLSEREAEILNLLAQGFRYQDIADQLYISFGTVRTHIYNIYSKMHVNNRTSAVLKWNSR